MSLKKDQKKRDFTSTPEPKGETAATNKRIYLIQEHHATHLHWDLRLEMDGVLKSWALPKEPPRETNIRRLAVPVEDHPIEYANFAGVIPEGRYGAGEVLIWDKGTYEPVSISENKIVINIDGEKLRGGYCLIRSKFQGKDSWLFFKMKQQ
jgi:DNA ligase D-like protein (predicted 3'-phosphoesterase)